VPHTGSPKSEKDAEAQGFRDKYEADRKRYTKNGWPTDVPTTDRPRDRLHSDALVFGADAKVIEAQQRSCRCAVGQAHAAGAVGT
jgi:hypothetical protein